jgi:hypothetical protein
MFGMTTSGELFPPTKEELKQAVARIAKLWPPCDTCYKEDVIFASIDNGEITSEKEINSIFMTARALML